ncbi:MAG: hypothetical protein ACI4CS_09765 [Candidatus Weimeria sp.]
MTKGQILEIIPTLPDITRGYYPTENEINAETEDADTEDFAYLILYFSTDPFTRLGLKSKDDEEYRSMVEYAKALADEFPDDRDFDLHTER